MQHTHNSYCREKKREVHTLCIHKVKFSTLCKIDGESLCFSVYSHICESLLLNNLTILMHFLSCMFTWICRQVCFPFAQQPKLYCTLDLCFIRWVLIHKQHNEQAATIVRYNAWPAQKECVFFSSFRQLRMSTHRHDKHQKLRLRLILWNNFVALFLCL